MEDQYKINRQLNELVQEMLRMLITYEIELTAYNIVVNGAQEKIIRLGVPWDMRSNIRTIVRTPALAAEAEAIYAPFFLLQQQLTLENLAVALASIKRRIADHEANIPAEDPV